MVFFLKKRVWASSKWLKEVVQKTYYEKTLLNAEFEWDKNSLSEADRVSEPHCLIAKDMF